VNKELLFSVTKKDFESSNLLGGSNEKD